MDADLFQYKHKLQLFIDETDILQSEEQHKQIGLKYSEYFKPCHTFKNCTIKKIFNTIMHYYFKNFYDQNAFIRNNRELRAIMAVHTIEAKEQILENPKCIDYTYIDEQLGWVFNIYHDKKNILNIFELCYEIVQKEKVLCLKVEMVLHLLFATIIRGYTGNSDDFIDYKHLLKNREYYEIVKFDDKHLISVIEEKFNNFMKNIKGKKNAQYIFELNEQPENILNTNPSNEQITKALANFKQIFANLIKQDLYLINFKEEIIKFKFIRGITLYNGKVLISECKELNNPQDIIIWYTVVLIHEMCHLFRLVRSNYAVDKSTPKKWMCEAGLNCTIELLGENLIDPQEAVDKIKTISALGFSGKPLKQIMNTRCYVGDMKPMVERFREILKPQKNNSDMNK